MESEDALFRREFKSVLQHPNRQTIAPTEYENTRHSQIAKTFLPFIIAARCVGCCPLTYNKSNEGIQYKFKKFSLSYLLTLVYLGCLGTSMIIWTLNGFLDLDYPVRLFKAFSQTNEEHWINVSLIKGSNLLLILSPLVRITMPWGSWMMAATHLVGLKNLSEFLNAWEKFTKIFDASFAPFYGFQSKLARKRNQLCLIWLPPIILYFIRLEPTNFMEEHIPWYFGAIYSTFMAVNMLTGRTVCYLKDFLIIQSIQLGYMEVLNGIRAQYSKTKVTVCRENVQDWKKLIVLLRVQTSRVSNYISLENIWSITELFFSSLLYLTVILFLVLNDAPVYSRKSNFLPFAFVFTFAFVASLYWKASLAESITTMEDEIADEITRMDDSNIDCETRLENRFKAPRQSNQNEWINENMLRGSQVIKIASTLPRMIMPWGSLILTFAHGLTVNYFCEFLNGWTEFIQNFESTFDGIPIIFAYLFSRFISIHVMAIRTLCYVKDFMLLQSIQMGYNQVLEGIRAQYGKFLLYLTTLIFLFTNDALIFSSESNFLSFAVGFTSFFLFSFHLKAYLAESITSKEEEIVEELIQMDVIDDDTRLEMKIICDMICNDPTKIQLAGLVNLDKSLLLSINGQLGVVFSPFTRNGDSPNSTVYTKNDVTSMLEQIANENIRHVATYTVGAPNEKYEWNSTWQKSSSIVHTSLAAAEMNRKVGKLNLVVFQGIQFIRNNEFQQESELEIGFKTAIAAEEIFQGTVGGIIFPGRIKSASLFQLLDSSIFKNTSGRAQNLKLKFGVRLIDCKNISWDYNNTIVLELVRNYDFIICRHMPNWRNVKSQNQSLHSIVMNITKWIVEVQNSVNEISFDKHTEVILETGWPSNAQARFMRAYWKGMARFSNREGKIVFMKEAFDRPWKNIHSNYSAHFGLWDCRKMERRQPVCQRKFKKLQLLNTSRQELLTVSKTLSTLIISEKSMLDGPISDDAVSINETSSEGMYQRTSSIKNKCICN
ncbi:unnamed protein product [Orchesella dallaii]|uniref:Uncharacterized protein n=1 Tax=Orchesella dallaii TaxID=48710 RepID=A0ABP1RVL6_9HEXA